jgi:hypothetical protein
MKDYVRSSALKLPRNFQVFIDPQVERKYILFQSKGRLLGNNNHNFLQSFCESFISMLFFIYLIRDI